MTQSNVFKVSGLLVMAVLLMLAMCSAPAFAEEGGNTISVQISVGEHGTVNEHSEDFTETVSEGTNLILTCQADEGYVILCSLA